MITGIAAKTELSSREPPLLMNNCQINPEWERWLKTNYPDITDELTNANVFIKMLQMRAILDIILKENWNNYSHETLELLSRYPEHWELLQTMDLPKPTWWRRIILYFFGGKKK